MLNKPPNYLLFIAYCTFTTVVSKEENVTKLSSLRDRWPPFYFKFSPLMNSSAKLEIIGRDHLRLPYTITGYNFWLINPILSRARLYVPSSLCTELETRTVTKRNYSTYYNEYPLPLPSRNYYVSHLLPLRRQNCTKRFRNGRLTRCVLIRVALIFVFWIFCTPPRILSINKKITCAKFELHRIIRKPAADPINIKIIYYMVIKSICLDYSLTYWLYRTTC